MVAAAVAMVDELGAESLTLALLAGRLGVKAPSLYKHVDGLADLRAAVTVESKRELAGVLERAAVGHGGAEAIVALADAYRAWAKAHPGRYPMTIVAERADDAEDIAASSRLYAVVAGALRALRLDGEDEVDAIRALRASLHGFVGLEAAGAFGLPDDVDRSFALMVADVVAGLERRAAKDGTPAG
ncbi:TetR/AcrR family transcriptional regulator [Demequina salsinemoris]|uniref:TetR/AcrR family transcriptional regulator n=1 Tax=Demequina salsinemoris TaxID=577470 RepID=UPI000A834C99|nr:TetR-like C-terminal domain-containing protein [Demequina salsinemoris]